MHQTVIKLLKILFLSYFCKNNALTRFFQRKHCSQSEALMRLYLSLHAAVTSCVKMKKVPWIDFAWNLNSFISGSHFLQKNFKKIFPKKII